MSELLQPVLTELDGIIEALKSTITTAAPLALVAVIGHFLESQSQI